MTLSSLFFLACIVHFCESIGFPPIMGLLARMHGHHTERYSSIFTSVHIFYTYILLLLLLIKSIVCFGTVGCDPMPSTPPRQCPVLGRLHVVSTPSSTRRSSLKTGSKRYPLRCRTSAGPLEAVRCAFAACCATVPTRDEHSRPDTPAQSRA